MGILQTIKMLERKEGKLLAKLEMAKKMKELGIDLNIIIKISGFSLAKIESL